MEKRATVAVLPSVHDHVASRWLQLPIQNMGDAERHTPDHPVQNA
jgi:hypothetical protein